MDLDGADLLVRAGLCVLVVAPAGFLMGFGFPTGMRLVSAISTGPTPWFWGINGAAGVLAASVAIVTSISFSIDTTLQIGAVCYLLVAAPALLLMSAAASTPHPAPHCHCAQLRSIEGEIPNSLASRLNGRPLLTSRATASRLNSSVK